MGERPNDRLDSEIKRNVSILHALRERMTERTVEKTEKFKKKKKNPERVEADLQKHKKINDEKI